MNWVRHLAYPLVGPRNRAPAWCLNRPGNRGPAFCLNWPRRRGLAFCMLFCLSLCCLSSCARRSQQHEEGLEVQIETVPAPPVVGEGALTVRVTDPQGRPVSGAKLRVEGTMAHAGMASAWATMDSSSGPGTYRGRIQWTMAGDWILIVYLETTDGREYERRVSMPGVRTGE